MAEDIPALIAALDSIRDSDMEDAREKLVPLGPAILPHAAAGYARLRTWRGRLALVYATMKFARRFDEAVELAVIALEDRSVRVRSIACAVLAFSLRRSALQALTRVTTDPDPIVAAAAAAAIDAIRNQDHDRFRDRDHTGRVHWTVGGSEPYL
jgi:hypothetical protein